MVKKMTEGVGKKIVEALKRQSEIDIIPIPDKPEITQPVASTVSFEETIEPMVQSELAETENFVENQAENDNLFNELAQDEFSDLNVISDEPKISETKEYFTNEIIEPAALQDLGVPSEQIEQNEALTQSGTRDYNNVRESFVQNNIGRRESEYRDLKEIEEPVLKAFQKAQEEYILKPEHFEIPSNISVLKRLIAQLPSGVSKHTGAQIIKQTMEALGISMKSVLQEAQEVQEGLHAAAKECLNSIQEYKKQITVLEKQAQNYNRQYSTLNELISLFIQTDV